MKKLDNDVTHRKIFTLSKLLVIFYILKFERYSCFLTLEEKLHEVDKFIEALLIDKHPKKNVKRK